MANWVYVENNTIKEYHDQLPRSWRNISGLDKASDEWLLSKGWYRVQKKSQSFDLTTQKVERYIYEIKSNYVEESMNIVSLAQEEIQQLDNQKRQEFLSAIRTERNRRLAECDWTQHLDVQLIKPTDWVESWRFYRQQLRDLPDKYKTSSSSELADVSWPSLPDL